MIFIQRKTHNMSSFDFDLNLAVLFHSSASVCHLTSVLSLLINHQLSKPLNTQFPLDEVVVVDEVKYVRDIRGCV